MLAQIKRNVDLSSGVSKWTIFPNHIVNANPITTGAQQIGTTKINLSIKFRGSLRDTYITLMYNISDTIKPTKMADAV